MKKQKKTKVSDSNKALMLVLLLNVTPFFHGLFNAYNVFFTAIAIILMLGLLFIEEKHFIFTPSKLLIGPGLLAVGAIIAALTTTSHGLAFYGCMRLVACGLYILLLMQCTTEERDYALATIPGVAAVSAAAYYLIYLLPEFRDVFFNDGRLWGTFEYCNVYALYLVIAFFLWLHQWKDKDIKKDYFYDIQGPLLVIGILWTGSRTVFLVFLLGIFLFGLQQKKARRPLLIITAGAIVLAAIVYAIAGANSGIGRIATIFTSHRSLLERFVFWRDGLSVLLAHPLGLGYKGFTMVENTIQTGQYAVQYVHNDWLQIALDHGVLGFVGFVTLFVMGVKQNHGVRRLLLVLIGITLCMEFALQFYWVTLLLLTLYDWNVTPATQSKTVSAKVFLPVGILLLGLNIWIGIAAQQAAIFYYHLSLGLYPWDWQTQMQLITGSETSISDWDSIPQTAESILKQNPWNSTARSALALYHHHYSDYDNAIAYGWEAIEHYRFNAQNYDNLVVYYNEAIQKAQEAHDSAKEQQYIKELFTIQEKLEEAQASKDDLALAAEDHPQPLELNENSKAILEKYR